MQLLFRFENETNIFNHEQSENPPTNVNHVFSKHFFLQAEYHHLKLGSLLCLPKTNIYPKPDVVVGEY